MFFWQLWPCLWGASSAGCAGSGVPAAGAQCPHAVTPARSHLVASSISIQMWGFSLCLLPQADLQSFHCNRTRLSTAPVCGIQMERLEWPLAAPQGPPALLPTHRAAHVLWNPELLGSICALRAAGQRKEVNPPASGAAAMPGQLPGAQQASFLSPMGDSGPMGADLAFEGLSWGATVSWLLLCDQRGPKGSLLHLD